MKSVLLSALLALLLSSCGFQLRGRLVLPAGLTALKVLTADPLNPLKLEVERTLRGSGVVLDASAGNVGELQIQSEVLSREILSVNDRARVAEYLLRYQARVRLVQGERELLPPTDLEVSREYSFDEVQALGASQEEELITEELRREMAQQILTKVSRAR